MKPVVFVLCLVPLAFLLTGDLGANPAETLDRALGDWALRFLIITLAVTPARRYLGWKGVMRYRRMLGLYAFFYAVLHFTSYLAFHQGLDWTEIGNDIVKRKFITVGMIVFLMLLPLAVTSTKGMIKRLGGKNWQVLHRLIYPAAALAVLHYFLMIKADYRLPAIHGAVLLLLFALRWSPGLWKPFFSRG